MLDCGIRLRPAAADQHSDAEQRQRGVARLWDGKIETTVGMIYAALGGAASRRAARASFSMQRRKAAKGRRTPVRREENTAVWLPPPLTCRRALTVIPPAWAAEVYSSNIVGYQKLTIKPGFNMIPGQFVTVGDEELIPIADMFSDAENATATRNMETADRIDTWNAATQMYVSYYRMTNRQGTSVWWGKDGTLTTPTTDAFSDFGQGAFYYSQNSEEITLTTSGQVKSDATTIEIAPGFNLICNPYPAAIPLTEDAIDWSAATANRNMEIADRIDTWDADNQIYVSYYRMTNRKGDSVWWGKDGAGTATTDSIPAGTSFFYYNQASAPFSITLESPAASATAGE